MQTLAQILNAFAALVGADVGDLKTKLGDPAQLTTTEKSNLVLALNEVRASAQQFAANIINDAAAAGTSTYSSTKIEQLVAAAISGLVDNAPTAFDTLKEIADYIAADQTAGSAMLLALDNRVRFDAVQVLTDEQKQNVWTTIGIGDATEMDLVTIYTNARDGIEEEQT